MPKSILVPCLRVHLQGKRKLWFNTKAEPRLQFPKNISSPSLGSFMSFLPQLWMPCASFSLLFFLLTKHSRPLACWLCHLGCFPASATPYSIPANLCKEDFSSGHPLPWASTIRSVIAQVVAPSPTAGHPARRVKASPQTA